MDQITIVYKKDTVSSSIIEKNVFIYQGIVKNTNIIALWFIFHLINISASIPNKKTMRKYVGCSD